MRDPSVAKAYLFLMCPLAIPDLRDLSCASLRACVVSILKEDKVVSCAEGGTTTFAEA
jgi:hypothetical protein